VVLVLWYKDALGKPIYSFDLREKGGEVIPAMESHGRSQYFKLFFAKNIFLHVYVLA
jgi:hypothetical protein